MKDLKKVLEIAQRVAQLIDTEEVTAQLSAIEEDVSASDSVFPVFVLSPAEADAHAIRDALAKTGFDGSPVLLEGYRNVSAWKEATLSSLDRARLLIVTAYAAQLVSSRLGEVLNHAGTYKIPVFFYVTKMGKIADPVQFAESIYSHVAQAVRGGTLRVTALNDLPRYPGPSLEDAIMNDFHELGSQEEIHSACQERLAFQRSQELYNIIEKHSDIIRTRVSRIRKVLILLLETENGLNILAGAEAASAAGRMKDMGRSLSEIDVDAMWHEIRSKSFSEDPEASMVKSFTRILKEKIQDALRTGSNSVEATLDRSSEEFFQHLSMDMSRTMHQLETLFPTPMPMINPVCHQEAIDGLQQDRCEAIRKIMSSCDAFVTSACDGLMSQMMILLRTRIGKKASSSEVQAEESTEDDQSDDMQKENCSGSAQSIRRSGNRTECQEGDAEERDDKNDLGFSLGSMIKPWLDRAEESILRSKTEEIMSEVLEMIRVASESASSRWKEILSEHVAKCFHDTNSMLKEYKMHSEQRLSKLRQAIESLEH